MIAMDPSLSPELAEFRWFVDAARPPRRRTMRQFAEQEIVLPTGPFEGRRYSVDRQPFARLLLDEIDSARWSSIVIVGPSQSGKTLTGSVIPVLYHLFECCETVIYAASNSDMVNDKWKQDLLPAILRTRYRDLLPSNGGGSRGGTPMSIQFKHGVTLRFMTGGGGDKSVASFTSRVLVVTEVDGFDVTGASSREASKIKQLEARTRAFGRRRRIYKECTVSTDVGHIWTSYQQGSASRLALPCPHCRQFVTPEREHFVGWETAEDVQAAAALGAIHCPRCGEAWSEADRISANQRALVVHKGQEINPIGEILGDGPKTDTLGFRWTAANNLLWTSAEIAKEEWEKSRELDDETADLEMRQFVWTLPAVAKTLDVTPLTAHTLMTRQARSPRGLLPVDTTAFTVGCDLGKYLAHWVGIAWQLNGTGVIVDYGQFEIPSDSLGFEAALLVALRAFRDRCEAGWTWEGIAAPRPPDQVWIDSGYQGRSEGLRPVYLFVRESGPLDMNRYQAVKGFGEADGRLVRYQRPGKKSKEIVHIGEEYHFTHDVPEAIYRVDCNADHWKTFFHNRLSVPLQSPLAPGSLVLCQAIPKEHTALAKHLTSEKQVEEYLEGRGYIQRWERVKKANHYFDAGYMACAAGHFCGVRLLEEPKAATVSPETPPNGKPRHDDDRPYFILERGE